MGRSSIPKVRRKSCGKFHGVYRQSCKRRWCYQFMHKGRIYSSFGYLCATDANKAKLKKMIDIGIDMEEAFDAG